MSLTSLNALMYYPKVSFLDFANADSSFTFDGSTDLNAVVFRVPATGTIANVHYRINTVSSPVLTLRIEMRTVDATTGLPNAAGTLYGSSTSITSANPTTGNKTAAVNCTGATAGDLVAVVFDLSAFTSGSFTQTNSVGGAATSGAAALSMPYGVRNTTGSTAKSATVCTCMALEYSGGVYYPLTSEAIVGTMGTQNVNSTTPRAGNRIRVPVGMRAVGLYVVGNLNTVDCTLKLRLQSDDSVVGTCTIDKDFAVNGNTYFYWMFDSAATATLSANTDYYALLEQSASASNDTIRVISSIPAQAQLDQINGGQNCYFTTHNGSVYSDVTTSRGGIGIIFDQIDTGSGASGVKYRVNMGMS